MMTFRMRLFSLFAICSVGILFSCEKSKSSDGGRGGVQEVNPIIILKVLVDSPRSDVDFFYSLSGPDKADVAGYSAEKRLGCADAVQRVTFYYDPSKDQPGYDDWIELCKVEVPATPCDTKVLKIVYNLSDSVTATCDISDKN